MTTLTERIERLLSLPDVAIKDGHDHMLICLGEEQESERLKPIHQALMAVVRAFEDYECEFCCGEDDVCERCSSLALVKATVESMEGEKHES